MPLSKQEHIVARHVVDASSKQATTAIALRYHAWLRAATLPDDARLRIEDMPFDGVGLFNVKTDEVLKEHQQIKRTACSYSNQSGNRPFKQQWCRSYQPSQYNTYQTVRPNADRTGQSAPSTSYAARQQFNRFRPKQSFHRMDWKGKQGF